MNDQATRLRQSLVHRGLVPAPVVGSGGLRIITLGAGVGRGATTVCRLLRQALQARGVLRCPNSADHAPTGRNEGSREWSLQDGSHSHRRILPYSVINRPHDVQVMVLTPDTESLAAIYAHMKSWSSQQPHVRMVGVFNQVTDAAHTARMEERLRVSLAENLGFTFSYFDHIPWQESLSGGMTSEHLAEVPLNAQGVYSIERIAAQIMGWEFASSRNTPADDSHWDRCGISCQTLAAAASFTPAPIPESGVFRHNLGQDSQIELGEAGWASRGLANQSCNASGDGIVSRQ